MDCGGTIGRYVTVSHQDVPLSLSEVEIYSTWNSPGNTVPQLPKPHGKEITHVTEILVMQSSIEKPKGHHICRGYPFLQCHFGKTLVLLLLIADVNDNVNVNLIAMLYTG